jgi:hypothetical protein
MCCLDGKNMLAQTTSKHGTRHENNNFNHPGSSSGQARGAKRHEGFLNYFNHPGMRIIIFVRVHSIIFRSEAAQAARWLCVTDGSIRLLQTYSAACAARLLNNRERLLIFIIPDQVWDRLGVQRGTKDF